MKKRFVSALLAVLMVMPMVPVTALATENASGTISGSCGDGVSYTLYDDGKLVISGNGAMDDFTNNTIPWINVSDNITSVEIQEGVTSIGDSAFWSCYSLTSVTVPDSVITIDNDAFWDCRGLTQIDVDENNAVFCSIDGVLFNKEKTELLIYPRGLAGTYCIPEGVTAIGEYAFADCFHLTGVSIPSSVTAIGNDAFYRCYCLTQIDVDENNAVFCSIDGVLFNKEKTELLICPNGLAGAYSIPEGVTTIGEYAFAWCDNLTSVIISGSVTTISNYAFEVCSNLRRVIIPNSVTTIGWDAFFGCSSLTSVTIPNSVITIGDSAFYGCSSLTSVTIPHSVTTIGYIVFYGCPSLTDIYFTGTQEQWLAIPRAQDTILDGVTVHYDSVPPILPPDLNDDGEVDVLDIQALYERLSQGLTPALGDAACDCNGDGQVNILDYQALYEVIRSPAVEPRPVGMPWDVAYTRDSGNSPNPEDYVIYRLQAQQLSNGSVRISLEFKAPAGMQVDAFDPPNGNLFMLFSAPTTGQRQTFTYTLPYETLTQTDGISTFFFGGVADDERVLIYYDTADILVGYNKTLSPNMVL